MNGIELGISRYIREANLTDSPEARAAFAERVRRHLGGDAGASLSADAVTAFLLERRTAWLLGRL